MTTTTRTRYPKLRNVDARPIVHEGHPGFLLRDPLQLTDKVLLVPQKLASVLALCDGTRENSWHLSTALALEAGFIIDPATIDELLKALDESLLLHNDHFTEAREQALKDYRDAPMRPSALPDKSYPADVNELRRLFDDYVEEADKLNKPAARQSNIRGLVSPHIDYARGGPVYGGVWRRSYDEVKAADLVVILGTDHYGGKYPITLTRQNYATPFGVLPTARSVVDKIAEAIGKDEAFAGELSHRGEHSIELASVWMHYIREGRPVETLPILCGSFSSFVRGDADIDSDPTFNGLIEAVKSEMAGRRVVIVAAGDLSHVGPAFSGEPVGASGRVELQKADDELIDRMCAGDARGFFDAVKRVEDKNNVCGVSPIYLALRMLEKVEGERTGYDRCPADDAGTSLVSICGVIFS